MLKKLTAFVALLSALSVLTGCGNDEDAAQHETQTAPNGDRFNEADVAFATEMIQHHAQATQMANMTLGRNDLDPKITRLAEDIRATQSVEIETMVDWLTAWDQPIPETMRDHANAHGDGEMAMDSDMPGMMSSEAMSDLDAAQGDEFQQMWLEMMVEHHEGAIEMAQVEQSEGEFGPAVELAETIESAQQDEISTMQDLLGS